MSLLRDPVPPSASVIDLTTVHPSLVALPAPRGPITEQLIDHLRRPLHELSRLPEGTDDPLTGDDSPLALHLCYELHYGGLPDVDESWEWEPTLLRERRRLERRFEQRLQEEIGPAPIGLSPSQVAATMRSLAAPGDAPSLSAHIEERGTKAEVRELAVHRSAYQLKEADPHTWGIPRLRGRAKAALVDIQIGEYGGGRPDAMHARLFADTMRALDLDAHVGAYVDRLPGITLSTGNLISLFGLHRRWRGALVGHLALFEMCSVTPMARYATALRRLGLGRAATRFYDEHVVADERHQVVALDDMVGGLLEDEPELGGEVVHGARALAAVERRFTAHVLDAWASGASSLRPTAP